MSGLSDEIKGKMKLVMSMCDRKGLRWPKNEDWSGDLGKKKKGQEIYSIMIARAYDVEESVAALVDKFGQEKWALDAARAAAASEEARADESADGDGDGDEEAKAGAKTGIKHDAETTDESEKPKKKRKAAPKKEKVSEAEADADVNADGSPKKAKKAKTEKSTSPKVSKLEVYANNANRGFGDALLEMAQLYYKAALGMKGGSYSKAAKAIRESEEEIRSGKEAMKIKGIGKSIGLFIDEFLEKGFVERLEKMRAGEL